MSYNAWMRNVLNLLGIVNEKLPVEGTPVRTLRFMEWGDVQVWVTRKQPHMTLRVQCECPVCGKTMAVSRLRQHIYTTTCLMFKRAASTIDPSYGVINTEGR